MRSLCSVSLSMLVVAGTLLHLAIVRAGGPSAEVRAIHQIPHLNKELQPVSSTFDLTVRQIKASNPYIQSVAILPVIIMAVSVGSWLILVLCLLCRYCCTICRCGPHEEPHPLKHNGGWHEWRQSVARTTRIYVGASVFFLVVAFLAVQGLLVGNSILNSGMQALVSRTISASTSIQNIAGNVRVAASVGKDLITNVNESTCFRNYHSAVVKTSSSIASVAVKANSTIGVALLQTSQSFDQISHGIYTYGVVYKDYFVYVCYAVVVVTCIMYAFGLGFHRKWLLQMSSAPALVVVLVLSVACGALLAAMTILADFCMDPAQNAVHLLPPHTVSQQVASYYANCLSYPNTNVTSTSARSAAVSAALAPIVTGSIMRSTTLSLESITRDDLSWLIDLAGTDSSDLQSFLDLEGGVSSSLASYQTLISSIKIGYNNNNNSNITDSADGVSEALASLTTASSLASSGQVNMTSIMNNIYGLSPAIKKICPRDGSLLTALGELPMVIGNVQQVADAVSCSAVTTLFHTAINNGVCGPIFTGLYSIFICLLTLSGALFLLICLVSVLWEYYDDRVLAHARSGPREEVSETSFYDAQAERECAVDPCFDTTASGSEKPVTPRNSSCEKIGGRRSQWSSVGAQRGGLSSIVEESKSRDGGPSAPPCPVRAQIYSPDISYV